MSLDRGTKLGPYEILEPLGAGGMGEVYKARDTRLDRMVALKVSHQQFSERVEREARAIAALNHPHICQLHDVGPNYLVMEYIEGQPLKGPLPAGEALRLGSQILAALDAAHRKGIVHRDLKPGNILVSKSGIKLLDFGLAKLVQPSSGPQATEVVTRTSLTQEGTIVGTLQYMAPEQLEGKEADERSDIFAFGVVLYELLTGRRAFQGESQAALISAIMTQDPLRANAVQPAFSPMLDYVLSLCLKKSPDDRWQSVADVKAALEWVAGHDLASQPAAARGVSAKWAWPIAAAIVLAALAIGFSRLINRQPAFPRTQFREGPPAGGSLIGLPAISPDGRSIALQVESGAQAKGAPPVARIWVRPLDSPRAQALSGTEGVESLFWSPDSRSIAFTAGGYLKKVDVQSARVQMLASVPGLADSPGAWSPSGEIVVPVQREGLFRIPDGGGNLTPLTGASRTDALLYSPAFLPDGRHFVFCVFGQGQSGIYASALDAPASSAPALVWKGNCGGVAYVNPGYLVALRGSTLTAQRFDPRALQLKGEPFPVSEQPFTAGYFWVSPFTASVNGSLVYWGRSQPLEKLVWFDRAGRELSEAAPAGSYSTLALSPDGRRLAMSRLDSETNNADIWVLDLLRSAWLRISFDPDVEHWPVWSPDGSRLVYESHRNSTLAFYEKVVDSPSPERFFLTLNRENGPCAWSPSGREVLYFAFDPKTKYDLWVAPVAGEHKPAVLVQTPFNEECGDFSPDEDFLVYTSDETGFPQVLVQQLSRGADGVLRASGRRWQISSAGGTRPRWRKDGKEIFFMGPSEGATRLMSVPVKRTSSGLDTGAPVPLFAARSDSYVASPDGQRFLIAVPATQSGSIEDRGGRATAYDTVTVILNLFSGAKQ